MFENVQLSVEWRITLTYKKFPQDKELKKSDDNNNIIKNFKYVF